MSVCVIVRQATFPVRLDGRLRLVRFRTSLLDIASTA